MATALRRVRRYTRSASLKFQDWFVRPVLGEFARQIYGNGAGLVNNVKSEMLLRQLRRPAPVVDQAGADRIERLRRDGYLKWQPGFSPELLGAITAKFQTALRNPQTSYAVSRGGYQTAILEPTKTIPELCALLTPPIADTLRAVLGTHIRVKHVNCWRIVNVPDYDGKREVFSNFWHCDEYLTSEWKFFVNLSDVTRESGATQVHPVGSTREIMRSGFRSRFWVTGRARRLLEEPSRIVYGDGPVGTALLLNAQLCVHRAGMPAPGLHRDIVQFVIDPSAVPLGDDWPSRIDYDPVEAQIVRERRGLVPAGS